MTSTGGHSKTARSIREGKSLLLRKQILKTNLNQFSGKDSDTAEIFREIEDSGLQYLEKLQNLESFKSRSRSVTKAVTLHAEWTSEHVLLQRAALSLENELSGILEVLLLTNTTSIKKPAVTYDFDMSTYEEDGDLFRALMHEDLQLRGTLDQHKSSYRRQMQELKAMFRDTKRKKEKTTEERSSKKGPSVDPTPSSSSSSSSSAVSSVFADILLQLRVELDEKWAPLSQAERELNCEVRSECRKVSAMLGADRLEQQMELLRSSLLGHREDKSKVTTGTRTATGTGGIAEDEDEAVAMLIEEWTVKLAMLDDSHQKSLKQFALDRAAVRSGGCNVSLQDHFNCSAAAPSPIELKGSRDNSSSNCVSPLVSPLLSEDIVIGDENYHGPVDEEGEGQGEQTGNEGVERAVDVEVDRQEEQKSVADDMGTAAVDQITRITPTTGAAQEERNLKEEDQVTEGKIKSNGETAPGTECAPKPVKRIRFQANDLDSISINDSGEKQQYPSESLSLSGSGSVLRSRLGRSRMQPSSVDSSSSSSSSSSEHSRGAHAWSDIDRALFTKAFRRMQVSGMTRKDFLLVLRSHLPHKTEEDILGYEDRYRRLRALATRQGECVKMYESTRATLMTQAHEEIRIMKEEVAFDCERAAESLVFDKRRSLQHVKLLEMRAVREAKARLAQAEQRLLAESQEREKARKDTELQQEICEKKQKISEFKIARDQLLESQHRDLLEEKNKRDSIIKSEIDKNKANVQSRRDILGEKEMKKRQKEEDAEAADARRLAILMQLSEQVPYWDSIQHVKSNLSHVTASARGHEYHPMEEAGRGHLPLNGFADNKVISDARFRLATALRQAGVQHTDAARHAVAAMCPRPHLAIHGIL